MELNTILIILGVIALIVLVVHGIWANRREKSTFFKNQSSFVDDSRVEKEIAKKQQNMASTHLSENSSTVKPDITCASKEPKITSTVEEHITKVTTQEEPSVKSPSPTQSIEIETVLKEKTSPFVENIMQEAQVKDENIKDAVVTLDEKFKPFESTYINEDNLSVEEAVEKIKIRVPQSNISKTKNLAELSIAELEASIEDEDEGFNTHAPQIREQLANLSTKKVELNNIKHKINEAKVENESSDFSKEDVLVNHEANAQIVEAKIVNVSSESLADNNDEMLQSEPQEEKIEAHETPKVVMLYIVAPEGKEFTGEALESCFEKEGFLFGDKQIYHRHADLSSTGPILFSLANVQNPGIFDPKTMEDFTTFGVVLFMQIPSSYGNDLTNLRLMISTAKAMAKELNGSLLTDQQEIFNQTAEEEYLNRVK